MKKAHLLLLLIISIFIFALGCTSEKPHNDVKENPPLEDTKTQDLNYKIVSRSKKAPNAKVNYPQVQGLEHEDLQDKINWDLENSLEFYIRESTPDSPLTADYEVTYQGDDILSIIINGEIVHEGETYKLLHSVNFDLTTGNQIFLNNLLKNDQDSIDNITKLLEESHQSHENTSRFQGFGDWYGIYFTEKDLVFYYLEDETSTEFTQLPVPLEDIRPYFKDKIEEGKGEHTY